MPCNAFFKDPMNDLTKGPETLVNQRDHSTIPKNKRVMVFVGFKQILALLKLYS